MAVSEMKIVSIIGLMDDLEEVVKICGKSGIFQPDNVYSFYSNTEMFKPVSEENGCLKLMKIVENIAKDTGRIIRLVNVTDFDVDYSQVKEYIEHLSEKFSELINKKKDMESESKKYKNEILSVEKFRGLNQKISELTDCEYVKVRFGKLPIESLNKISSYKDEDLVFFPCTKDSEYCWGIYFAPSDNLNEIDRLFSGLYFEDSNIESFDGTVDEKILDTQSKLNKLCNEISEINKKIDTLWKQNMDQCLRFYSKLCEFNTFYRIKRFAAKYNESFILMGWIPAENEREFCGKLSEISGIEYSTDSGGNLLRHSPPVKLKNKKIFRPFEFFVDTYGLPSYDEIDPTVFVSITYTILFGIMFADLGQGLIVSVVGYLMWKFKKMKLGKPLITCGIASAIFGVLFGSVFGFEDTLDPLYKRFGLDGKPIEVMSSRSTNLIIYTSVGIGIVLLIMAMILNIYSLMRRRRYGEAVFSQNGITGLIFYVGSVVLMLDMMIMHIGLMNVFYITGFILVPLVLIMFSEILSKIMDKKNNWRPESWGDYLVQGVFELFEVVLSYFSNTLSFIRIGAFVFVHAGIMVAVFKIAEMFPNARLCIIIFGNIFVICLEALLSGIQAMRLQYYELFSRFYEGEGRPFEPVVIQKEYK